MGVCPQGLGAIGFIVFFTREYDIFGMLFGKVKALLFRQLIFRDRTQNITGLKKALFRNTIGSLTTMDSGYFWWGGYVRNGGSRVGHIGILRSWGHRNHCAGMLGHMTTGPPWFSHIHGKKNMMFLLHQKWCLKIFKHKVLNHMFKFLSNHFWWGF